jgi:putative endonuclease
MSDRKKLGGWGESYAAQYLTEKGYTILERNVRTAHGEIDLVADHQSVVVFVEVKTRTSRSYGYPEESVTPSKQAHLLASAQAYLQSHPDLLGDWRIDVIAIERRAAEDQPVVAHFENAVSDL